MLFKKGYLMFSIIYSTDCNSAYISSFKSYLPKIHGAAIHGCDSQEQSPNPRAPFILPQISHQSAYAGPFSSTRMQRQRQER